MAELLFWPALLAYGEVAASERLRPILDAILEAAFGVFATYGFRRTSMDDIAKAAGMSRSALYLHYRNKEDIFRSLTQRFMEKALRDMAEVLSRDQPPERALIAAFAVRRKSATLTPGISTGYCIARKRPARARSSTLIASTS